MTDTPQKSSRWLRIALIASLAVNLLVAGLVVGASFSGGERQGGKRPPPREAVMAGDLRGLARAMPERPRQLLRDAIGKRPVMPGSRRESIRANRLRFLEALQAEPFDLSVIEEIFAEQHAQFSATALDGQAALLEAIEGMTEDERKAFAQNLQRGKPERKKK